MAPTCAQPFFRPSSNHLTRGDSKRHASSVFVMPRRGGAPSTGGSAGAAASPSPSSGGTTSSSLLTPEKRTSSASASFEQKWHTPQKPIYGDLTPALKCNRPSCNHDLRLFIPPGTKPNGGVTFAACSDLNCAGGGSLLAFDTNCDLCYRVIPAKSVCLSLPSSVAGKKSEYADIVFVRVKYEYRCLAFMCTGPVRFLCTMT